MNNPFRMQIPSELPTIPCIFKITAGKKFFIWKSFNLKNQYSSLAYDIDRKLRRGCKEGDFFEGLIGYLIKARITVCKVSVEFISDNTRELMTFEQKLLDKSFGSINCLNTKSEPYTPNWISTSSNGAIGDTFKKKTLVEVIPDKKINTAPEIKPVEKIKSNPKKFKSSEPELENPLADINMDDIMSAFDKITAGK